MFSPAIVSAIRAAHQDNQPMRGGYLRRTHSPTEPIVVTELFLKLIQNELGHPLPPGSIREGNLLCESRDGGYEIVSIEATKVIETPDGIIRVLRERTQY